MNIQLIEFQTTDGLSLPGILYTPKTQTDKVVINLHGNGSSSVFYGQETFKTIGKKLTDAGYAFLVFNNRGAHYVKSFSSYKNGKKIRKKYGMSYEIIRDCTLDIDAAAAFCKEQGFTVQYLAGISTGANKICVYNYYKPQNHFHGFILLAGGDDSGIFYSELGEERFNKALEKAHKEIKAGNGESLATRELLDFDLISYQSAYDLINPDGDYNVFPFYEVLNGLSISKKPKFREYKSINKPTIVIYGANDEYCYGKVPEIVQLLKEQATHPEKMNYKIIPDASHGFDFKEEELANVMVDWLRTNEDT